MPYSNLLFNSGGRLRSGWRVVIFVIAYLFVLRAFRSAVRLMLLFTFGRSLTGYSSVVVQALILLASAILVGWACGRVLEDLPLRALGWALHRRWWRDFLIGSLLGAASLGVTAGIAAALGGLRFASSQAGSFAILNTLASTALLFIIAAAAERITYLGYPFQTLLRAHLAWIAILLSSIFFAWAHLGNPNVAPGFTFINTTLAGVWFGIAYLRTRSLWFPLGLHWAWNWTQGALLGVPVSGNTRLIPAPLLHATDAGPAWLTGGAYGMEGGAACTVAIILSTIFIWRTRLINATEEMKRFTEK